MSKNDKGLLAIHVFILLCIYCLGLFLGATTEESTIVSNWCESVHEGQMQGNFCITPENVAIPRPEWSK